MDDIEPIDPEEVKTDLQAGQQEDLRPGAHEPTGALKPGGQPGNSGGSKLPDANPETLRLMNEYNLTAKEARLIQVTKSGEATSKTDAARKAGYGSPNVVAPSLFRRPRVSNALEVELGGAGITQAFLAQKARQLLDAQRTIFDRKGNKYVEPDNATQARVLELTMRCLGWLESAQVNVAVVDGDSIEVLKQAHELVSKYQQAVRSAGEPTGAQEGESGTGSDGGRGEVPSS